MREGVRETRHKSFVSHLVPFMLFVGFDRRKEILGHTPTITSWTQVNKRKETLDIHIHTASWAKIEGVEVSLPACRPCFACPVRSSCLPRRSDRWPPTNLTASAFPSSSGSMEDEKVSKKSFTVHTAIYLGIKKISSNVIFRVASFCCQLQASALFFTAVLSFVKCKLATIHYYMLCYCCKRSFSVLLNFSLVAKLRPVLWRFRQLQSILFHPASVPYLQTFLYRRFFRYNWRRFSKVSVNFVSHR